MWRGGSALGGVNRVYPAMAGWLNIRKIYEKQDWFCLYIAESKNEQVLYRFNK